MDSNSSKTQKNSRVSSKPENTSQHLGYISQYAGDTQVSKPDEKRNPSVSDLAYDNKMLPKKPK